MATITRVDISDDQLAAEARPLVDQLTAEGVASQLSAGESTLWGPEAEPEAAKRLGWVKLHETSRPLLAEIDAFRAELAAEGLNRIVLAGMGGSSLAPEVITTADGCELIVLDTTDASQVLDALAGELERTVLVVSSKSGSTVETDTHRRIFAQAFTEAGVDPARRMVVVTDEGSPLHELALTEGYRKVFTADPEVGGRYSALTAFGLVPAGLAGADVATLLDDAAEISTSLSADSTDNPALWLAASLAAAHAARAEKVVLTETSSQPIGFGDWAEQLIAESTGKDGTGLLPVVVEDTMSPGFVDAAADATTVALGPVGSSGAHVYVDGPLGGLFLLWEYAIAIAGRLLSINPFDQPDVEEAKAAARSLLDGPAGGPAARPAAVDGPIEVHVSPGWASAGVGNVSEALRALLNAVPSGGYLSIQAYLDRIEDASCVLLRSELARRSGVQTTFGWGPRFLHSTGQYHKGGHQNGAFLQITGAVDEDIGVPGRPYTLAGLQRAQALGDGQVLADHERPVLRLHLLDRVAGLVSLTHAIQQLRSESV